MKDIWAYSLRLFCLNLLIALLLGVLVISIVLMMPGQPLIVYSLMGFFCLVYLVAWFYYAKWVYHRQMEDVLIPSSLIGFSPHLVLGIVGLVYVGLLSLLAGKPSTIFVYGVLSLASISLAVVGSLAILLYKKRLDKRRANSVN